MARPRNRPINVSPKTNDERRSWIRAQALSEDELDGVAFLAKREIATGATPKAVMRAVGVEYGTAAKIGVARRLVEDKVRWERQLTSQT